MKLTKLSFFEIYFTLGGLQDLAKNILKDVVSNKSSRIKALMVVSMQDIVAKRQNETIAAAFKKFDVFTPDGMPLVWLAHLLGGKTERLYGPDIFEAVLALSEHTAVQHFFYGTDQKTLNRLVKICLSRWPKLKIAGFISPPFRALNQTETRQMIKRINAAKPSIVWIGLGSWKQILFTAEIKSSLNAQYVIPVGMAFDVVAGNKRQAPVWLQQLGLEWLFRLFQEPTRLWRRYVFSVPLFALWWLQELFSKKFSRSARQESAQ